MDYKVEVVDGTGRLLGEGPHWDHDRQHLYFVDALKSTIIRYVPAEKRVTSCRVDDHAYVSIVIPVKGSTNKFAVTIGRKLTVVTWDGESSVPEKIEVLETVEGGEAGKENNRFNDGKVDPTGRLWVGTMGFIQDDGEWESCKGSLYSFDKGGKAKAVKHFDGVTISNGLAWPADLKHLYYIDTMTKRVDMFDYDPEAGRIANRRAAFDFGKDIATDKVSGPDGMAIDTDGNLWVAVFGSSGIFNVNPRTGKLLRKVEIPSRQTTSVTFGGANLDELFVTSATFLDPQEGEKAGCTFRVTGLGVRGLPGQPAHF